MSKKKAKKEIEPSTEKHPGASLKPSTEKRPKVASSNSYHNLKPSWRISRLEMVDPYGWHTLNIGELQGIREKLTSFESMTWSEILVKGKKFNHSVQVDQLSPAATSRLAKISQDDVDELVSLHLSSKERVWGILDQGILTLLWWDPDHQVCPSQRKNT